MHVQCACTENGEGKGKMVVCIREEKEKCVVVAVRSGSRKVQVVCRMQCVARANAKKVEACGSRGTENRRQQ